MIAPEKRLEAIRQRLQQALQPVELDVLDESHLHAGHEGAKTGKGHFAVRIVAAVFVGQRPLARHRLVYDALGAMMIEDIHALRIDAQTPDRRG